jgi:hypothetical protein
MPVAITEAATRELEVVDVFPATALELEGVEVFTMGIFIDSLLCTRPLFGMAVEVAFVA